MSPFIINVLIVSIFDLLGIISGKLWSLHKNPWWLVATALFFAAAGLTFARSLRYEGIAITNILWVSFSALFITVVGYFVFKENISLLQFAGMLIIIVGLAMINWK